MENGKNNILCGTAKRLLLFSGLVCLALLSAGAFFARDFAGFARGVAVGYAGCAARVVHLDRSARKTLRLERGKAENYARLVFLVRHAIAAGALLFAALVPGVSLWGAAAGTISLSAGAYLTGLYKNYKLQTSSK